MTALYERWAASVRLEKLRRRPMVTLWTLKPTSPRRVGCWNRSTAARSRSPRAGPGQTAGAGAGPPAGQHRAHEGRRGTALPQGVIRLRPEAADEVGQLVEHYEANGRLEASIEGVTPVRHPAEIAPLHNGHAHLILLLKEKVKVAVATRLYTAAEAGACRPSGANACSWRSPPDRPLRRSSAMSC
jgi:hypothetical protein